jgi:hypothetical protein
LEFEQNSNGGRNLFGDLPDLLRKLLVFGCFQPVRRFLWNLQGFVNAGPPSPLGTLPSRFPGDSLGRIIPLVRIHFRAVS